MINMFQNQMMKNMGTSIEIQSHRRLLDFEIFLPYCDTIHTGNLKIICI